MAVSNPKKKERKSKDETKSVHWPRPLFAQASIIKRGEGDRERERESTSSN